MSICSNGYRVIGYPVCITNPARYSRNEYIFNLAVVVREEEDVSAYVAVVRKMARLCRDLEVQSGFLSADESGEEEASLAGGVGGQREEREGWDEEAEGGGKVYALCDMVLDDLNNYSECMILIGMFPSLLKYASQAAPRRSCKFLQMNQIRSISNCSPGTRTHLR